MTVREVLRQAGNSIEARDAQLLLATLLKKERSWLLAHDDQSLSDHEFVAFLDSVARRALREPLQYITGTQEFFGLPIHVEPSVLIPRPETELLVEGVLHWIGKKDRRLRIIDVGTGSGAIALALASRLPNGEIIAVDASSEALSVADGNARALGIKNVRFAHGDLLQGTDEDKFDVIVSNPPYVPTGDIASMQCDVVDYEPHLALFAGDDGLDIYRRLIPQAKSKLRPCGLLAMEFGYGQKAALQSLLSDWDNVRFTNDYADIPRVVLAETRLDEGTVCPSRN